MKYKIVKIKKQENNLKKFWEFLKADTWQSWIVSIILIILFIKFILFPSLSLITGSPLPLVVIESCSMYHESGFEDWWGKNSQWYESKGISKSDFESFSFSNGLNKGDIMFVIGKENYKIGDIIIFTASAKYPLIHRIISANPIATKGDHNSDQLDIEREISKNAILGKSVVKIPFLGWVKLIFFESYRYIKWKLFGQIPSTPLGFC